MKLVKANANDLILDNLHKRSGPFDYVYLLVCRADKKVPRQWNLIPEVDLSVMYSGEAEYCLYKESISEVMKLQALQYPQINQIRETLQTEIDAFNKMVRATSVEAKFDKIK